MDNIVTKELIAKVIGSRKKMIFNPDRFLGYPKIIDAQEYSIYERPIMGDKIVAAYGNIVVKQRGDVFLKYIPDSRVPWLSYCIKLNEREFSGLYKDSKISQCLLLPYLRRTKQDTYIKDVRLCVFTNKGQIFHNKPSRSIDYEGYSLPDRKSRTFHRRKRAGARRTCHRRACC